MVLLEAGCPPLGSLETQIPRCSFEGKRFPEGKGPGACPSELERSTTVQEILENFVGDTSAIDSIVSTVSYVMECQTAYASLLTKERTYMCSGTGFLAEQVALPVGLCHWALLPEHTQILIVEDMQRDERMRHHWLATVEPPVRFYIAAPLVAANNQRMGTLCILDHTPRKFSPGLAALLINFAELVAREFEAQLMLTRTRHATPLLRSQDCYNQAFMFVDLRAAKGRILHVNSRASEHLVLSISKEEQPLPFADVFHFRTGQAMQDYHDHIENKECFVLRGVQRRHAESGTVSKDEQFDLHFRPGAVDELDESSIPVGIPSGSISEEPIAAATLGEPRAAAMNVYFIFIRPVGGSARRNLVPPIKGLTISFLLGAGAFARVYRGFLMGKPVAVKIAKNTPDCMQEEGCPLEASLTVSLDHNHVVRQYTHKIVRKRSSQGDAPTQEIMWLIQEFCDKGSMEEAIAKGWFYVEQNSLNGADMAIILCTAVEVASAMEYLHTEKDILHCDLSKGNIFLKSSSVNGHGFTAMVGDFGLCRRSGSSLARDTEYGTPMYKAPETMIGGATFSKATDVYAFGVLMWEMCIGKPAWEGLAGPQITYALSCGQRLPELPEGFPPRCRKLVAACLDTAVEQRPTFGDIVRDLRQQAAHLSSLH